MENLENLKNEIVEGAATKAAADATQAATKVATEKSEELKAQVTGDMEVLQNSFDEMKETMESKASVGIGKRRTELNEKFNDAMSDCKRGGKGVLELKSIEELKGLSSKAFSSTAGAGSAIYRDERVGDIKYDPNYQYRLRNVLMTGSTSSAGSIRFNQEATTTDYSNVGTKVKGTAQANVVQDLADVHVPIQTIQAINSIPEEWLDDTAMIESYLSTRLMGELMDAEDENILNGNPGTGAAGSLTAATAFQGINTNGRGFTNAAAITDYVGAGITALYSASNLANFFDVLSVAKAGMANTNFHADVVILNPLDAVQISLIETTGAGYLLNQTQLHDGMTGYFWQGMKVVQTPAQAVGTFTLVDTKKATQYWMREGVNVEFDRNGTDFAANSISVRAKVRGNVTNYRPNGIVSDRFVDWTAALNA